MKERTQLSFVPNVPSATQLCQGQQRFNLKPEGRWLPDGNIEFLGRIDHQVKIAASASNLEKWAVLSQHSCVQETGFWQEDELGNQRLVAYVVANADKPHHQ